MNKIFLAVLLVNFSFCNLFSQKRQGKIIYLGNKTQAISKEENKESVIGKVDEMLKNVGPVEFELTFNNEEATYKKTDVVDDSNFKLKLLSILLGGNNRYYLNLKTHESFYQTDAYGAFFIVNYNNANWVLTKESKKIEGYNCMKATTNYIVENIKGLFKHKVIAWYAPEIPINFGPKGYYGLPGLILELQEGSFNFVASEINLNLEEEIKIVKPQKGRIMTQKEFDKLGMQIDSQVKK